ncbi:MAG: ABC transporter ATP-binding protein/permease [Oscillospiraceae bacterium]|jgi:ATP-binding cassette subfamily B protein|nr:ABC transporter ATP-binding protein/permease [Oscillospiraceae bacterium]
MKTRKKLRLFGRGIRTIHKCAPGMLINFVQSPIMSIVPFVNIYFSAQILEQLTNLSTFAQILPNILWCVGLNAVVSFANGALGRVTGLASTKLYIYEHQEMARVMLGLDYETLESTATQKKYEELGNHWMHMGSPLRSPVWDLSSLWGGIITCVLSVAFAAPMAGVLFKKTGEGFLNSPWLAISVCIFIALGVGVVLFTSDRLNKRWFATNKEYIGLEGIFSYYSNMLQDHKTGKEVRIYAQQDLIEHHATEKLAGEGVRLQKKLGATTALSSALLAIIGAILGFGVYLLIGVKGLFGLIGPAVIVQSMGGFLQVVNGLMAIGNSIGRLGAFIPGLNYFFDVIDLVPKHTSGAALADPAGTVDIEFRDVSFRYPDTENYALRHVNFRLQGGEHLAIVGENGSGKTTFIKLLCRLYDPTEGQILLNGRDIRDYDEESYRQLFSVVFQDYQLFALPLGENLACAQEVDEERAMLCIDESGFTPRMDKMTQGLDTYLYRRCDKDGVEISGGEAQKLALARALYKDAPVIVLDEPTAALDPLAEAALYASFNQFAGGKAAIYISHRLSSCRFCAKVAVFGDGALLQYGSHEELIVDEENKYFELWNAQAKYYV